MFLVHALRMCQMHKVIGTLGNTWLQKLDKQYDRQIGMTRAHACRKIKRANKIKACLTLWRATPQYHNQLSNT